MDMFNPAPNSREKYNQVYNYQIRIGQPEAYAKDYAEQVSVNKSEVFAKAYAQQIANGKSSSFANAFANIIENPPAEKGSANLKIYATGYAKAKAAGESDSSAGPFALAYLEQKAAGNSEIFAEAYAQQIVVGKSEADSKHFAQKIEDSVKQREQRQLNDTKVMLQVRDITGIEYADRVYNRVHQGHQRAYADCFAAASVDYARIKVRYCSLENFQKKAVEQAHDYAKSLERSPIDAQAYAREEVIRKSEVKAKTCPEKKEAGRSTIGDFFRVNKKKTFFLVACLTFFCQTSD